MQAFIHGLVLAVGLILPLGVQNVFVFNQGVKQTLFYRTLPVIITAALCDSILILAAVQGVSLFIANFSWVRLVLQGVGILFLLYMGWLTWNDTPVAVSDAADKSTAMQQVLFAITVSLLNPHAVLDTIGVIGASSIAYSGREKLFFTLACILVSWCWFFALAVFGRHVGKQKNILPLLTVINKVSAVFMWGSALYMACL